VPRLEDEETIRTHIHIYKSDYDWIIKNFHPVPGYSKFIRLALRKFRQHIEAAHAAQAAGKPLPPAGEIPGLEEAARGDG